jgi:hypothetical protein
VSEYQYYEFTAVDRPLTPREQAELRSLSTRADITATSFVNTYEWGNFKGDPRQLMERYFDAHLYLANWGTRQLMLRLPKRVLDPASVADYCMGDSASAWTAGRHVIVRLNREDEDGTDDWDLDGHGLLASIVPVRAALAAGDLRLLYLGWLRCVQSLEQFDVPDGATANEQGHLGKRWSPGLRRQRPFAACPGLGGRDRCHGASRSVISAWKTSSA